MSLFFRKLMDNNPLRNFRLLIAYDGTEFNGWQRQKDSRTIQGDIETCLKRMGLEDISLHGAGRTDAGVHAEGMVAHFKTAGSISPEDFHRSLNSLLPDSIRIIEVSSARENFHARFSAKGKHYRYTIFNGSLLPPFKRLYAVHIRDNLNLETMRECLVQLEGTHDFSSFENSGSRDKSDTSGRGAVRTLSKANLTHTDDDHIIFDFMGDGFLRHMVRNLVGTLLEAGRERLTAGAFKEILHAKNRALAGPAAPPQGLKLIKVFYE